MKYYYVAYGLPYPGLHMTIAFLGDLDDDWVKLDIVKQDMQDLPLNFMCTFGEEEMFGENNDVPVRIVHVSDTKCVSAMKHFRADHNMIGHPFPELDLHVNLKDQRNKIKEGHKFIPTCVFLKKSTQNGSQVLLSISPAPAM